MFSWGLSPCDSIKTVVKVLRNPRLQQDNFLIFVKWSMEKHISQLLKLSQISTIKNFKDKSYVCFLKEKEHALELIDRIEKTDFVDVRTVEELFFKTLQSILCLAEHEDKHKVLLLSFGLLCKSQDVYLLDVLPSLSFLNSYEFYLSQLLDSIPQDFTYENKFYLSLYSNIFHSLLLYVDQAFLEHFIPRFKYYKYFETYDQNVSYFFLISLLFLRDMICVEKSSQRIDLQYDCSVPLESVYPSVVWSTFVEMVERFKVEGESTFSLLFRLSEEYLLPYVIQQSELKEEASDYQKNFFRLFFIQHCWFNYVECCMRMEPLDSYGIPLFNFVIEEESEEELEVEYFSSLFFKDHSFLKFISSFFHSDFIQDGIIDPRQFFHLMVIQSFLKSFFKDYPIFYQIFYQIYCRGQIEISADQKKLVHHVFMQILFMAKKQIKKKSKNRKSFDLLIQAFHYLNGDIDDLTSKDTLYSEFLKKKWIQESSSLQNYSCYLMFSYLGLLGLVPSSEKDFVDGVIQAFGNKSFLMFSQDIYSDVETLNLNMTFFSSLLEDMGSHLDQTFPVLLKSSFPFNLEDFYFFIEAGSEVLKYFSHSLSILEYQSLICSYSEIVIQFSRFIKHKKLFSFLLYYFQTSQETVCSFFVCPVSSTHKYVLYPQMDRFVFRQSEGFLLEDSSLFQSLSEFIKIEDVVETSFLKWHLKEKSIEFVSKLDYQKSIFILSDECLSLKSGRMEEKFFIQREDVNLWALVLIESDQLIPSLLPVLVYLIEKKELLSPSVSHLLYQFFLLKKSFLLSQPVEFCFFVDQLAQTFDKDWTFISAQINSQKKEKKLCLQKTTLKSLPKEEKLFQDFFQMSLFRFKQLSFQMKKEKILHLFKDFPKWIEKDTDQSDYFLCLKMVIQIIQKDRHSLLFLKNDFDHYLTFYRDQILVLEKMIVLSDLLFSSSSPFFSEHVLFFIQSIKQQGRVYDSFEILFSKVSYQLLSSQAQEKLVCSFIQHFSSLDNPFEFCLPRFWTELFYRVEFSIPYLVVSSFLDKIVLYPVQSRFLFSSIICHSLTTVKTLSKNVSKFSKKVHSKNLQLKGGRASDREKDEFLELFKKMVMSYSLADIFSIRLDQNSENFPLRYLIPFQFTLNFKYEVSFYLNFFRYRLVEFIFSSQRKDTYEQMFTYCLDVWNGLMSPSRVWNQISELEKEEELFSSLSLIFRALPESYLRQFVVKARGLDQNSPDDSFKQKAVEFMVNLYGIKGIPFSKTDIFLTVDHSVSKDLFSKFKYNEEIQKPYQKWISMKKFPVFLFHSYINLSKRLALIDVGRSVLSISLFNYSNFLDVQIIRPQFSKASFSEQCDFIESLCLLKDRQSSFLFSSLVQKEMMYFFRPSCSEEYQKWLQTLSRFIERFGFYEDDSRAVLVENIHSHSLFELPSKEKTFLELKQCIFHFLETQSDSFFVMESLLTFLNEKDCSLVDFQIVYSIFSYGFSVDFLKTLKFCEKYRSLFGEVLFDGSEYEFLFEKMASLASYEPFETLSLWSQFYSGMSIIDPDIFRSWFSKNDLLLSFLECMLDDLESDHSSLKIDLLIVMLKFFSKKFYESSHYYQQKPDELRALFSRILKLFSKQSNLEEIDWVSKLTSYCHFFDMYHFISCLFCSSFDENRFDLVTKRWCYSFLLSLLIFEIDYQNKWSSSVRLWVKQFLVDLDYMLDFIQPKFLLIRFFRSVTRELFFHMDIFNISLYNSELFLFFGLRYAQKSFGYQSCLDIFLESLCVPMEDGKYLNSQYVKILSSIVHTSWDMENSYSKGILDALLFLALSDRLFSWVHYSQEDYLSLSSVFISRAETFDHIQKERDQLYQSFLKNYKIEAVVEDLSFIRLFPFCVSNFSLPFQVDFFVSIADMTVEDLKNQIYLWSQNDSIQDPQFLNLLKNISSKESSFEYKNIVFLILCLARFYRDQEHGDKSYWKHEMLSKNREVSDHLLWILEQNVFFNSMLNIRSSDLKEDLLSFFPSFLSVLKKKKLEKPLKNKKGKKLLSSQNFNKEDIWVKFKKAVKNKDLNTILYLVTDPYLSHFNQEIFKFVVENLSEDFGKRVMDILIIHSILKLKIDNLLYFMRSSYFDSSLFLKLLFYFSDNLCLQIEDVEVLMESIGKLKNKEEVYFLQSQIFVNFCFEARQSCLYRSYFFAKFDQLQFCVVDGDLFSMIIDPILNSRERGKFFICLLKNFDRVVASIGYDSALAYVSFFIDQPLLLEERGLGKLSFSFIHRQFKTYSGLLKLIQESPYSHFFSTSNLEWTVDVENKSQLFQPFLEKGSSFHLRSA